MRLRMGNGHFFIHPSIEIYHELKFLTRIIQTQDRLRDLSEASDYKQGNSKDTKTPSVSF